MFGLDKLFGGGGLLGSFFDSIGMSWMNSFISLAVNISTGNWLAAAKDVFNLVSQFSNSWQNKVSQFQPLGEFGGGSCFGNNSVLNESRASNLRERITSNAEVSPNVRRSVIQVSYSVEDNAMANANLRNACATTYL